MPKPPTTKTEPLRAALAQADRGGVGRAYPAALRRAVVDHVAERCAEGVKVTEMATARGLPVLRLTRWATRERTRLFRPVTVMDPRIETRSAIMVHGPRGLRIEGLDAAALAELLRRILRALYRGYAHRRQLCGVNSWQPESSVLVE